MKYEAHITVEPREGLSYESFTRMADVGWRASKFDHDDVDGIAGKWFLTMGSDDHNLINAELVVMVGALKETGFEVTRWKLEATLADSKNPADTLEQLSELGPFVGVDIIELRAEAQRRGWHFVRDPAFKR